MKDRALRLTCCGQLMATEAMPYFNDESAPHTRHVCLKCGHYLLEGDMDEQDVKEEVLSHA